MRIDPTKSFVAVVLKKKHTSHSYYLIAHHRTIVLDDVRCTGTEDRLVDCSYDSSTGDCTHSEDAGVRCQITRECKSVC